jgi:3',5'-cyclic AMP phosphodiesterase CpdA
LIGPTEHNLKSQINSITRRHFLFGLASIICLGLPRPARASLGLYEPFSFAYVTDVHLCTGTSNSWKMLQVSQLLLQDVVKQLNEQKLDFVIFGGDQVERPGENDSNWQLFLDVVQSLQAPWTFVLGEQDVNSSRPVDKMRTYGVDWKGKGIETNTSYWSQSPLDGVHIIGLDTSRANSTTGYLDAAQLDWLKDDLQKNARRFTIVCSHHPLLPPPPFDGGPPWDDYIVPNGANAREILGASKYVRLALSGHVYMNKVQKERDIWYVSNPGLDVYPCAFRVFNVTPDDITVETYQVSFPALIKRARQLLATWPLAFKYDEKKPDAFCDLADGGRLDWNALLPLGPNGVAEPLRVSRRKKKETGANQQAAESGGKHKKHRGKATEKTPESPQPPDTSTQPPDKSSPSPGKSPQKSQKTKQKPDKSKQPQKGPPEKGKAPPQKKPPDNTQPKELQPEQAPPAKAPEAAPEKDQTPSGAGDQSK